MLTVIRESSDDGNTNENVTWKYNVILFVLILHNFNSLLFYRNGELPRNQIGRSGAQVKKTEWKIRRRVHVLNKIIPFFGTK